MPDINKFSADVNGEMKCLPMYQSHKRVWALEIDSVENSKLTFKDERYVPVVADGELFSRYMPIHGDFYVIYADGYKSFSPRKAFLEGYKLASSAPASP